MLFLLTLCSTHLFSQSCPNTGDGDPGTAVSVGGWPSIYSNGSITAKTLIRDANKSNDNQFTGGSKDVSLISQWVWSNGSTNNKGDISTGGAVLCLNGTDKSISFFGDRVSTSGDADIGFWFFRNAIAPVGTAGGGFSGEHAVGDVLVLVHFTNGGVQPTNKVFEWVGSGGSDGPVNFIGAGSATVNTSPKAVPSVNFGGQTWGYVSNTYPTNAFFEGTVDLTQLLVDPCFSSFLIETRNSQSVTASLQDFVTGVFVTTPPPPSTTGASRCGPGVVALSASGCSSGTLNWYDAATGGNLVNTGATYSPNLTATTTYYVACNLGGCEGARTPVTGTIKSIPAAPSTTGDSRCGAGVVSLSASGCTGGTLKWYDAASGGTQVNTGASFSPNISSTTTYYVSCTSAEGCEGPRSPVTGTIKTVPAAPSTTGDSRCGPGAVSLSASGCTGGTLKWYDASSGGNQVNTGASFSPNISSTTTYYVSCTSSEGCEGPRAPVTGTIKAIPDAPTVTYNAPACDASTFSVTVTNVHLGFTYTIVNKNGNAIAGVNPASPHVAVAADVPHFDFSNIPAGSGFQVTLTNDQGCTSSPNNCGTSLIASQTQTSSLTRQKQELPKVLAAPNPFNDRIRFSFQSPVSGKGSLELFTLMGQKVATVYQGNVQKGQVQTITYNVPASQRTNLIYVFRIGNFKTSSMLIGGK